MQRTCRSDELFIHPWLRLSTLLMITIAWLLYGAASPLYAHQEEDTRYVATHGVDQGDCTDPEMPCQTIQYAMSRTHKGDLVLVARGTYEFEPGDPAAMDLAGPIISVRGGYNSADLYSVQDPVNNPTYLIGAPYQIRSQLLENGFELLQDAKGLETAQAPADMITIVEPPEQATPCVDGFAGPYRCSNIDFLAQIELHEFSSSPASANDVWGFVDLNDNREYAIIGLRNGTAVVDVTDPENPIEVGTIPGLESTWRDVKVYQVRDEAQGRWRAYAYITSEDRLAPAIEEDAIVRGVQVIDLTDLPDTISLANTYTGASANPLLRAHNVYIGNVDYSTGVALPGFSPYLAILGSNLAPANTFGNGAFRILGLDDPAAPVEVTAPPPGTEYAHDATSLIITDSRTSACSEQHNPCEILVDFNEDTVDLWDITDRAAPFLISDTPYTGFAYTHSGWWSADKMFVFIQDELDERDHRHNTVLRTLDISNLASPFVSNVWTGPTPAIDHNGFAKGARYYISNYERGLTVLDISNPNAPSEIGYFDTYPPADNTAFHGAWGTYPYLPSGTIVVGDIQGGLYLLREQQAISLPTQPDSQPISRTGYARATQPSAATYAPDAAFAYNSSGGAITVTRSMTGTYAVRFAELGGNGTEGGTVQVTAFGAGTDFCKASDWDSAGVDFVVNVLCFDLDGNAVDSAYTVLVLWIASAEAEAVAIETPIMESIAELPQIEPPAAEPSLLDVQPEALTGAIESLDLEENAQLPAYDGDPFMITLPAQPQSAIESDEDIEQLLAPILQAVGFERGIAALSAPPGEGIRMPVADAGGLAEAVQFEYESENIPLQPETEQWLETLQGEGEAGAIESDDAIATVLGNQEIQYPFQQLVDGVPIEHTLLVASRQEGQSITSVWGALINNYAVANTVVITPAPMAISAAITALNAIDGVEAVTVQTPEDGPYLVLLPYGSDTGGVIQLRYAYRMILRGLAQGQEGPFLLWLDAEEGNILKLEPLFGEVEAAGVVYNRDPSSAPITTTFEVDPAVNGQYVLKLNGVIDRVDFLGNGFDNQDLSIPATAPDFANFDQVAITDAQQALCGGGTNKAFQQVNFFASFYRYYDNALSLGVFTPFPTTPWKPKLESATAGCNANSLMDYGACRGYFDPACPNFSTNTVSGDNYLNFAHDNTVVGHELAHNLTDRLAQARPANWCGAPFCIIPAGWNRLHDLADFWADHFESTNCTGGWVAKNQGGVDASLNCRSHTEGGGLPRIHVVTTPFDPSDPGDHFPEHRRISIDGSGYSDGQIGAAALWQVRTGIQSIGGPAGLAHFALRFTAALRNTGFFGPTAPTSSDQGIYRYLYDLEAKMLDQWATAGLPPDDRNGSNTTNKVTAGFARAGLFLVPYQCLDGNVATGDPGFCPTTSGGENGGDAVIDIDDGDPSDDLVYNGALHPEVDFLAVAGPAPSFHVWTGPRYRLDGFDGSSSINKPSLCNTQFRVEIATDPAFPPDTTITSPWITVDTDPTSTATPECYGVWTISNDAWILLQEAGEDTQIYYRARTQNAAGGNERLSTMPGNGLRTVSPPYAIMTADGQPDF